MNDTYKSLVWHFLRQIAVWPICHDNVKEKARALMAIVPWYQWNDRNGIEGMFYDAIYAIAYDSYESFAYKWNRNLRYTSFPWYDVVRWAGRMKLDDILDR